MDFSISYRSTPLNNELNNAKTEEERKAIIRRRVEQLKNCSGFDLVVEAMREMEAESLSHLHVLANTVAGKSQAGLSTLPQIAGRLWAVGELRRKILQSFDEGGIWKREVLEDFLDDDLLDFGPVTDAPDQHEGALEA